MKEFPEKWCIRGCRELEKWCMAYNNPSGAQRSKVTDVRGGYSSYYYCLVSSSNLEKWNFFSLSKARDKGYTEISFDDFLKYIVNKEAEQPSYQIY